MCLSETALRQLGSLNSNWKGKKVKLKGLHKWIIGYKPKPLLCERCGKKPPLDCANISGEYRRDINDYEWLCRRCHMEKDGRLEKFRTIYRYKMPRKRNKKGQFIPQPCLRDLEGE